MKISGRERNLLIVAGVLALLVAFRLGLFAPSEQAVAAPPVETVEMAERKLARMRQAAVTLPGKETLLKQALAELETKEKGLIQAETAQQAQAQLLQVIRTLGKAEAIDARGGELGPVRPLGEHYGEVSVAVVFECRIEQLVNFLAALTAQPELLATSEVRITSANPREKTLSVRLTLSGVVARKLVPEQKGAGQF